MRALRQLFSVGIVIGLSPLLLAAVATGLAQWLNCDIGGGGLCDLQGYDITALLTGMLSLAWFGLIGLPAAGIAALVWCVAEIAVWVDARYSKSLRF